MWGWSPGDGTFGTGTMPYLRHAKQQGTRIVCVDPRRTNTSRILADEHVFIRPSSDTAALLAMAYVIVTENLHDQAYCDRYVLGFDEDHLPPGAPAGASYRSYLLGLPTACPRRRSGRSRSPASRRQPAPPGDRLRHQQAGGDPGRLCPRPHRVRRAVPPRRRRARGDHRQCRHSRRQFRHQQRRHRTGGMKSLSAGQNPIDARVASPLLADLLARGRHGGYPADIKLIYSAGGDLFNQCPERRQDPGGALDGVEFIVAQDNFLTPTARYADHRAAGDDLLGTERRAHALGRAPGTTRSTCARRSRRCMNAATTWTSSPTLRTAWVSRATTTKSEQDWLRELTADAIDDFDAFTRARRRPPPAARGCGGLRAPDPRAAAPASPRRPAGSSCTPRYLPPTRPVRAWRPSRRSPPGFPTDPRTAPGATTRWICARRNPAPARIRSTATSRASPASIPTRSGCIRMDAAARGIVDGADACGCSTPRAPPMLPATVTDRIAPGVVSIKEGAWFAPGAGGHRYRGLRQRADHGPVLALRRDHL